MSSLGVFDTGLKDGISCAITGYHCDFYLNLKERLDVDHNRMTLLNNSIPTFEVVNYSLFKNPSHDYL